MNQEQKLYNGDVCLEHRVSTIEAESREREKILNLTAQALEKRLEMLNELRGDVMTRGEYQKAHEALIYRIESVEKMQGKGVAAVLTLVAIVGIISTIIATIALFSNK